MHIAKHCLFLTLRSSTSALESSLLPTLANLAAVMWGVPMGVPQNGWFIVDKSYMDDLVVSPFEISSMKWYEDLGSSGWYTHIYIWICIYSHLKFATAEELSLRIPSAEIGTQSVFSEKLFRLDPKAFRVTALGSITAPLASWNILKFWMSSNLTHHTMQMAMPILLLTERFEAKEQNGTSIGVSICLCSVQSNRPVARLRIGSFPVQIFSLCTLSLLFAVTACVDVWYRILISKHSSK